MARDPFRYIYLRQERLWWTCYACIFLKWNRQWRELVLWWDLPSSSGQGYRMQDSSQTPWGLRWWWRGLWGGQITKYLEANSQIDQGGARALAGRGDCQDILSCTQLVGQTKQKGFFFFFFLIYTHFCFQGKLKYINPEARTSLEISGYFLQVCQKFDYFVYQHLSKALEINLPNFNKLLFLIFLEMGNKGM